MRNNSKLYISGIGFWHKIWLRALARKSKRHFSEDVMVVFNDKIESRRYDSLWYGGEVAEISYKQYKFLLSATGDVYANLMDKWDGGRSLFYVKDKNNRGLLADELIPYIRTDRELYAAMRGTHIRYLLEFGDNNWWECFLVDPEGNFHDLMLDLASDVVFEAVAEILTEMDRIIEYSRN